MVYGMLMLVFHIYHKITQFWFGFYIPSTFPRTRVVRGAGGATLRRSRGGLVGMARLGDFARRKLCRLMGFIGIYRDL